MVYYRVSSLGSCLLALNPLPCPIDNRLFVPDVCHTLLLVDLSGPLGEIGQCIEARDDGFREQFMLGHGIRADNERCRQSLQRVSVALIV